MVKFKQFLISAWEIVEVLVVAIVAVWLIRSFLIQPFLISGASMEPNFSDGHYLLVDQVTYKFREPQRGEIAVFRSPADSSIFFIKRLIGLPGESIVVKGGSVFINGEQLKEGYIASDLKTFGDQNLTLEENEYFVLGDNRAFSFDSRNWGPLGRERVIGVVRLRLWPLNQAMAIEAPAY
ncbi:signal peptidase I [Candidatus Wolfebacteria bacterium RIFCSPLOWO2_01_FULL_45_19]|uniref:Signal peptidase I n=1 Tax=Candidatus Wolfebacteria bacterium RIFCSPLOWO2_01_FULL_45_19 TaxID=1802557 RepID=A0A1F8DS47_9BACT|nr:MAG: Signal peptidase I [Parcubacteria group bacterium GW2011_GWB1_45_9]OGM90645.1 MAG: signal peptidase I [Candidatus Wolfebacteria bacterium RIFCSPLOWO2_01_FULL_45_19]